MAIFFSKCLVAYFTFVLRNNNSLCVTNVKGMSQRGMNNCDLFAPENVAVSFAAVNIKDFVHNFTRNLSLLSSFKRVEYPKFL